jgi:hypothetical protein
MSDPDTQNSAVVEVTVVYCDKDGKKWRVDVDLGQVCGIAWCGDVEGSPTPDIPGTTTPQGTCKGKLRHPAAVLGRFCWLDENGNWHCK